MITFKSFYEATEETIKTFKQPLVKSKNKRAFDAAIDDVVSQKLDLEDLIYQGLKVVTKEETINVQKIIDAKRKIKECEEIISEIEQLRKDFFEED
jgi:hypothetical protein